VLLFAVPFHSVLVLPGVSVVKAIGIIITPIWLIWILEKIKLNGARLIMPRRDINLFILFGIFFLSILLSAIYHPISPDFVVSFTSMMLNAGIVIIIYTLLPPGIYLRPAYTALTIGSTLMSVLVILQFAGPPQVASIINDRIFVQRALGTPAIRATGAFRDPNYAAFSLSVLAILSFYLALSQQKRLIRVLLFFSVSLQVIAIILTFSRAGYVITGLVGLIILLHERHNLHLRKVAFTVIAVILLLTMLCGGVLNMATYRLSTLHEFTNSLIESPTQAMKVDQSLWYRFQLLVAGSRMAFDAFPLGIGWENFRYQITQYSDWILPLGPHNTYVGIAAELGLPGILVLLMILVGLWKSTSASGRITNDKCLYYGSLRYGLLAILFWGLFLTLFYEVVVWVLFGLIMAQNKINLSQKLGSRT